MPAVKVEGKTVLKLLKWEIDSSNFLHPITTVTFFDGPPPIEYLQTRVANLVSANPWLAAYKAKVDRMLCLVYNADGSSDTEGRLDVTVLDSSDVVLHQGLEYLKLTDAVATFNLKSFATAAPTDPLFKVVVVRDPFEPETRFALVISISHVLCDGHDYYKIYKMLAEPNEIISLSPVRNEAAKEAAAATISDGGQASLIKSPGFIMFILKNLIFKRGLIKLGVLRAAELDLALFEVDADEVAAQKAAADKEVDGVPFISTNDIITSWFCRLTETKMGGMVVNFRGKIDGCKETDVGNYHDMLGLYPGDYDTATLVRKSLTQLRGAANPPAPRPSFMDYMNGRVVISAVTNWASFISDDLALPGCTQRLHIPALPDLQAGGVGLFSNGCIVFRPRAGRIGVMVAGKKGFAPKLQLPEFASLVGTPIDLGSRTVEA